MMAEDVYRTTFDRIEELFKADRKVSKINIELLGGELTMMPLEFWERNLPWTLERMAAWDALYDAEAALIWCTNLIFKDDGYVDLLNRMGQRSATDSICSFRGSPTPIGSRKTTNCCPDPSNPLRPFTASNGRHCASR